MPLPMAHLHISSVPFHMPLVSYGFWEVAGASLFYFNFMQMAVSWGRIVPPPYLKMFKTRPRGHVLQTQDAGSSTSTAAKRLHLVHFAFFSTQLLRLQKGEIKQRGCLRQWLSNPLWFNMARWHKHIASSKKKRKIRGGGGRKWEKALGKIWAIWNAVSSTFYVNLFLQMICLSLKTEKLGNYHSSKHFYPQSVCAKCISPTFFNQWLRMQRMKEY